MLIDGILLQEWGRSVDLFLQKHYPPWVRALTRVTLVAAALLAWSILATLLAKRGKAREIVRAYALVPGADAPR